MKRRLEVLAITALMSLTNAPMLRGAQQLVADGNAAFAAGRLDEAAAIYLKATAVPAERATALFNLGVVRARLGDDGNAAIVFAESILGGLPGEARAWALYNRGVVLANAGQIAEGVDSFKQALRVLPGNDSIRTNLQIALARLKRQPPRRPPPADLLRLLRELPDQTFSFVGARRAPKQGGQKDW